MKKLFLKTLVLSLALSNLPFNEAKAVDLSTAEKAIIGVFSAIGLIAIVLAKRFYNNYQKKNLNVNEFYKEFDNTFGDDLLDKMDKLLPTPSAKNPAKLRDIIKSLRTSMGDNIKLLIGSENPISSEEFIQRTNNALNKAMRSKFKEIKEDINFTDVLSEGFKTGKYSEYLTQYISGSEKPLSEAGASGLAKLGRTSLPKGLGIEDYPEVSSRSLPFQETEQQRELTSSSLPTSLTPSYGEESYLEHSYEEPAFVPRGLKL